MIKIIQGVYGYNNGKSIIPKTVKDEPFSDDKEVEKRLVESGIAIYVTEAEAQAQEVEDEETSEEVDENQPEDNSEETNEGEPAEPTREDLIKMYKDLGLKGNPAVMKDETLKAKIAEAAELVEDEEAPELNTDDGVEA